MYFHHKGPTVSLQHSLSMVAESVNSSVLCQSSPLTGYLGVFILAQIFNSMAGLVLYSLGRVLLDTNVSTRNGPVYQGLSNPVFRWMYSTERFSLPRFVYQGARSSLPRVVYQGARSSLPRVVYQEAVQFTKVCVAQNGPGYQGLYSTERSSLSYVVWPRTVQFTKVCVTRKGTVYQGLCSTEQSGLPRF